MIEAMGNIEGKLVVASVLLGSNLNSSVYVNNQVAGYTFFSRYRLIAEADNVGRSVFIEIFPVGMGYAVIISQNNADFAPDVRSGYFFNFSTKPIS